jgi:hypothetical protein
VSSQLTLDGLDGAPVPFTLSDLLEVPSLRLNDGRAPAFPR